MPDDLQYKQRLSVLRKAMKEQNLDVYLVPRADEWLGEFVAPYAERLFWISGFTGSAGLCVITQEKAYLFTDARYTLQAAKQTNEALFEVFDINDQKLEEWLSKEIGKTQTIGFDPWLHTQEEIEKLNKKKLHTQALEGNLIDDLWHDQPDRPATAIHNFPDHIAGDPHSQKCNQIRWFLEEVGVRWYIITQPDSIAWLLNIRASDVIYIPQALSYLMISDEGEMVWFVEPARVSDPVKNKLSKTVKIVAPDEIESQIEICAQEKGRIVFGMDFKRAPVWFKYAVEKQGAKIMDIKDPCLFPKSLKTFQEQEAIRQAHIADGVAVSRFLKWFEEEAGSGQITEIEAADKLESYRSLSPIYCGPSFPTIAGFGANGAIIHYRATDKTDTTIEPGNMLLIDSGGQYHYGTTDITRTMAVGDVDDEMKENFTHVLKGHIAVANARFEDGTTGKEIDALARKPIKKAGLDFAHGTGHGVGCFLAVHEHAANLSPKGKDPVKPGMLLSNEPGYYKENHYGIRIENLVLCTFEEGEDAHNILQNKAEEGGTYIFETISLAPIDRHLIVSDLLSDEERDWLNSYHKQVFERLSPFIDDEEKAWLKQATAPID